jgi:hypothetical protein
MALSPPLLGIIFYVWLLGYRLLSAAQFIYITRLRLQCESAACLCDLTGNFMANNLEQLFGKLQQSGGC